MSKVTSAIIAEDFDTPAIGIFFPMDGSFEFVVEGGPSTSRLEFTFTGI
jgi:hypothetical protein